MNIITGMIANCSYFGMCYGIGRFTDASSELLGLTLGAANYLCMPDDPDHLQYQSGVQGHSRVAAVEYWYGNTQPFGSLNHRNAPCAVCYVATRSVSVMIPAKTHNGHWNTSDTSSLKALVMSVVQSMNALIKILNQFQD